MAGRRRLQRVWQTNRLSGNVKTRGVGGFSIAPAPGEPAVGRRQRARRASPASGGDRFLIDMQKESSMLRKFVVLAALLGFAGAALADFPLMNLVADKVIQKYQTSTCEQLWAQKQQPKTEQEQRLIGLLKSDPQLRTAFLNKIAGPISNKMFECGMIP
jgi:hypothetical protein